MLVYFNQWKLVLNPTKSELINIMGLAKDTNPKLRKMAKEMKVQIAGTTLSIKNNIRILGMQFQTNNRFTENIKIRINKATRAKHSLARIIRNKNISPSIKTNIYKMYIRPILTYAAPIWCNQPQVSSHQMEILRRFERGCLRTCGGIHRPRGTFKHIKNSQIYKETGCVRLDRYIALRQLDFFNKCRNSGNIKIKNVVSGIRHHADPPYKSIDNTLKLHELGLFKPNENCLLFHTRYNNQPGLIYQTGQ